MSSQQQSGFAREASASTGRVTRRRPVGVIAVVMAMALILLGCGSDGDTGSGGGLSGKDPQESPPGTSGSGGEPALVEGYPPEAVAGAADWPLPGRDYANSRTVLDSPISRSTIERLEVAWSSPLEGSGAIGNAATTPVVIGDTIYIQDLSSNVRAFDRATGELRWEQRYDLGQIGPSGVAVGWGKVFAAKGSRDIVALDAASGRPLWSTVLPRTETEGITIQPQVFGNQVLVSTVPVSLDGVYTGGDRGVLSALDVETGEIVWSFDTVEGEGVWGNEINSGGGAWYPPAIDPVAGKVFWGTGNPAPFVGTAAFPNGSSRPGDNLYTDSVVALDVTTGQLDWHAQATPHDIFDHDLMLIALASVGEGEDARTVVIGTGKAGRILGHDPVTGEVLFDTPVGVHQNDELTELAGPTQVLPGTYGGVLTPPSVADGVVYAAVVNAPTTYAPDEVQYIGGELGTMEGQVVAVSATDGSILWDTKIPGDPLGGTIVLSDLVLTATLEGMIFALDRSTGEIVWQHQAPGGINGWPAATADGDLVWPVGNATPAQLVMLRLRPE